MTTPIDGEEKRHVHYCKDVADKTARACLDRGYCECECGARATRDAKKVYYYETTAEFSFGREHRYWLERAWSETNPRRLVVIGLNPSTADELVDDPTIRRCINFAKREICGGLIMVNLFGYRATSPNDLKRAVNPAGTNIDAYISSACAAPDRVVVAAWGVHGEYCGRDVEVKKLLARLRVDVHHFGLTKDGHPRHPLYLAASTPLTKWDLR